ncbi:hypothetical protein Cflav_PD2141 [Pedosphaera parvula Ellin514]|uniref:Uncharacterized protein n=1 Tax=Pedosphaera parvula (strain Ellin514) TaxID=320771 RepID=B9XLP2_PEDPL|nr:hypothetical protein Cflav_PD2141 [Pedosphaera parvula Ellin514]
MNGIKAAENESRKMIALPDWTGFSVMIGSFPGPHFLFNTRGFTASRNTGRVELGRNQGQSNSRMVCSCPIHSAERLLEQKQVNSGS